MSVGEHLLAQRYELGRVLGQGGMAQVYDGRDRLLDRRVAVKVLHPVYATDHDFLLRFRREARAAASLSHRGIVTVYDTGQDGDAHYIVMEFVEGRTLAQVLSEHGAMPPERATAIVEDVCEALGVAHDRGLIHRDVKPGNVMLTATGQAKVMDFGIARAIEGATVITTAMSVMGTPRYMSPEQVEGETLDARSDLYSLGVVLYELLSGRAPFTGPTPIAVAAQHVGAPPPPLADAVPGLPAGYVTVTERALAKDPAQRPQSAAAFAKELAATRTALDPAAARMPAAGAGGVDRARGPRLVPVSAAAATGTATGAQPVTGRGGGSTGDDEPADQYEFGADYRLGPEYAPPGMAGPAEGGPGGRRATRWVAVLLGVVALLAIAGYVFSRENEPGPASGAEQPSEEEVPEVVGQEVEEARSALVEAGFAVEERRQASDTVPAGEVIGIDPAQGTTLTPGSTVALLVSSGPAASGRAPAPAGGGGAPPPSEQPAPPPSAEQPAASETPAPPAPSPSPTETATEPEPSPTASAEPSPNTTAPAPPSPDPTETTTADPDPDPGPVGNRRPGGPRPGLDAPIASG